MSKAPRVVVIGAGMGGLAAAIELAASGCKLTLLEQAAVPGGKMRELASGGVSIDSGPTVFTMRWVFDALLASAGTSLEDELTLHRAARLARHVWTDGARLDLFSDVDASVAAIAAFAGADEAAAYRRFARDSGRIYATLLDTFMRRERPGPLGLSLALGLKGLPRLYATRPFRSLWNELGRYFRDRRLRQLFARYATYCGSSPFAAPATLMLIAHVEREGVHYVDGGMQRLAECLDRVARRAGAELRYETAAAELRVRNGRVTGVVTGGGDCIEADAVVFNGDAQALTRGTLGDAACAALPRRRGEPRSLSALTWSVEADVDGFSLDHHTVFFGEDYPAEFAALFSQNSICASPTTYVCAQDRGDESAVPNGAERLFVLANAPPQALSEAALLDAQNNVERLLGRAGLTIDLGAANARRFSPADFAARFPESDGAIYGWPTHGMFGSFRRSGSRSKLEGLYLAGGSVHPGPGVPMAALSGRIAADAVRKDLDF
ncbi:MAG: 1-hydroxycarotenoid 3,4-desaturase CrtD [Pseudomonadota bacterium]